MTEITIERVLDKPYGEMESAEARLLIAREVGLNRSARAPFGLRDLNAIYAYLTGEHYFRKYKWGTSESPPSGEVREAIAQELEFSYNSGPGNDRPFVRSNLRTVARAVNEQRDERPNPEDVNL